MKKQRWIALLASIALAAGWPAAAPAQDLDPKQPGARIVSSELMDLLEAWTRPAELDQSPAEQGFGLLEFAKLQDPSGGLAREIYDLGGIPGVDPPPKNCGCWLVLSWDRPQYQWELEDNLAGSWTSGNPPTEWHYFSNWMASSGAARELDYWRKSEYAPHLAQFDETGHWSGLRVLMTCFRNDGSLRLCRHANACQGQLDLRIGYASQAVEHHDAFGNPAGTNPPPPAAAALTADLARITYDDPGPSPSAVLAAKGVAAGGELAWGASLDVLAGQFFAPLPLTTALAQTTQAIVLAQDLATPELSGWAGQIRNSGHGPGSQTVGMRLTWDNLSLPFVLLPEESHEFRLDTSSRTYGSGNGVWSETRNKLDSGFFIVGVARDFVCQPQDFPPAPTAFWSYDFAAGGLYGYDEIIDRVQTFADAQLGQWVPNVTLQVPGQYSP